MRFSWASNHRKPKWGHLAACAHSCVTHSGQRRKQWPLMDGRMDVTYAASGASFSLKNEAI
jgi:hypothetical protein